MPIQIPVDGAIVILEAIAEYIESCQKEEWHSSPVHSRYRVSFFDYHGYFYGNNSPIALLLIKKY